MMRWQLLMGLAAVCSSACILESPRYEGTTFSCQAPESECPDGYTCVDEVCRPDAPAADPGGVPDAGAAPQPPLADAAVPPEPEPDAMPGPTVTVTLSGTAVTQDTHIEYEYQNHNHGAEEYVSIDADPLRAGLLRFDLASIPPGVEVVSAEMVLDFKDPLEDGAFSVYRMLEAWEEDEATWNQRKIGVPWVTEGAGTGSYAPTPLFTLAAREAKAYTIPLPVATVQSWVTQPLLNHGMKWESGSLQGRGGEFDSSEVVPAATAPRLTIQYR